ncbi:carboxymuconolactone decarboxylase family protein [Alteromonas sp. 1_MG-2023]|uniref:carboxymuconolactone decarboxylase family protein n=1 Tax=Alteromonas sp. 1_MG-2023 TaxID=3062669 RepID=UPI0026E3ED30|nr:carboxymuconolactone decarboxylase family protein [Alteromonas sp. 1_MG-2023]MDO6475932.1 carboxymuconolactone decarboxylase family protein [Alteromonas sp. 1_MG-2023]
MQTRITQDTVYACAPRIVKCLTALSRPATDNAITQSLTDLVRLRVSQLNGCAFCLHMHAAELRQHGESQERLDMLQAWREVPYFTDQEKAALRWAETLTRLESGVSDDDYHHVSSFFDEQSVIDLTTVILEINSWNRLSIGFNFTPALTEKR